MLESRSAMLATSETNQVSLRSKDHLIITLMPVVTVTLRVKIATIIIIVAVAVVAVAVAAIQLIEKIVEKSLAHIAVKRYKEPRMTIIKYA